MAGENAACVLHMKPGAKFTIEVNRTSIAKRLGRLTGAGLFGESQKLGLEKDDLETGVVGCDSVQNAIHNGKAVLGLGRYVDRSLSARDLRFHGRDNGIRSH